MLLGNALAAISAHAGYDVSKVDIVNDRGVHICKSMLAYQKFGNNAEPDKKSDHYVGDWYVRYDQELKRQTHKIYKEYLEDDFSKHPHILADSIKAANSRREK